MGDLDRDGETDIVSGPYWYEGPDFSTAHEIYAPIDYDPSGYSNNFFAFVHDFNRDSWPDVLFLGFPGTDAYWVENPGMSDVEGHWITHTVFSGVDTESPTFVDLTGDGAPELVCANGGYLGWAAPSSRDASLPWTFHRASAAGPYQAFTHGLGVGDVDGDGRLDILEATGAWLHPPGPSAEPAWQRIQANFGRGGAQMYAFDVDGDGDSDVVTTLEAHGWGIGWYERTQDSGVSRFVERLIVQDVPPAANEPHIFEPHALAIADVNDDGLPDLVSGERFWGHVPEGDPDFNAPARLYWFELRRKSGAVRWIPHLVDDASGVGTQVVARDVSGDGLLDIVTANKKGAFAFIQRRK